MKPFKQFLLMETKIYDESYTSIKEVIDAFNDGQLLVHARHKDGTDFGYGIYPSAGELLKSTDAYQEFVDYEDDSYLPELIFLLMKIFRGVLLNKMVEETLNMCLLKKMKP